MQPYTTGALDWYRPAGHASQASALADGANVPNAPPHTLHWTDGVVDDGWNCPFTQAVQFAAADAKAVPALQNLHAYAGAAASS